MKTAWYIGFAQQLDSLQTGKTLALHFTLTALPSIFKVWFPELSCLSHHGLIQIAIKPE